MTGVPAYNAPSFREAATILRGMGHVVYSPVEFDEEEGFNHAADGSLDEETYYGFLRRDLLRILEADVEAGVALDGWERSQGAALEVHVLRSLGRPIYKMVQLPGTGDTMLVEVKEPTKYQPPTEETCLETAARLVDGDRGDTYGRPIDDFTRTATIASAILGVEIRPEQIPLLMIAVKLSRLAQTPTKRDSVTDIAGYALCYEYTIDDQGRRWE